MAIARGQISFVDLNDGKTINLYLSSNQPATQLYDVDQHSYTPNYTNSPFLVISPEVFISGSTESQISHLKYTPSWTLNGTAVTASTPNVVIGNLASGYTLTVKRNITDSTTMVIGCSVIYVDPDTGAETPAKASITFTKMETTGELIRAIAYAPRGTVFKNDILDYLLIHCDMWRGSQIDSTNVTYQWYRRDNTSGVDGGWFKIVATVVDPTKEVAAGSITGYTTNEINVPASEVVNYDVFKCVCTDTDSTSITYQQDCSDIVSIIDITDPYLVDFQFQAGTTLTQGMSSTTGKVFLWQNGNMIPDNSSFYGTLTYNWTKYSFDGQVDTSAKYANDDGSQTDSRWSNGRASIQGTTGRTLTVYRGEVNVSATYAVEIETTV